MNLLLPYLMLGLAGGVPAAVAVETASGDWSRLPSLQSRGYGHLNTNVMVRLHEIAGAGQCRLPGYDGRELRMRLTFAAHFDAGGALQRIVLPKLDCPEAEGIIGGAVLEMMRGGDYRATGKNPEGWYSGQFTFTYSA